MAKPSFGVPMIEPSASRAPYPTAVRHTLLELGVAGDVDEDVLPGQMRREGFGASARPNRASR